jgi:hypothetical protein
MDSSSQHEEHNGRAAIGCGPSVSNTNLSGPERPHPSGANVANPPSGLHPNSTFPSGPMPRGSETARGPMPTSTNNPFASGPWPTHPSRPNSADPRGNGPETEEEDDDTCLQRIDLRAVECCDEGVDLSTPPFPFYHGWDPQYRKKKVKKVIKNLARASDAAYEQWTADGKPLCPNCRKKHPPPCSAPSKRKRQAEEPAEGSTARASRRRMAIPRNHQASAQTAPATMDPPPAPSTIMPSWDQVIATPESRAQHTADLSWILDGQERMDNFHGMLDSQLRARIAEASPQTATAPSASEGGWSTHGGDWSTQGGWPTQSDWAS